MIDKDQIVQLVRSCERNPATTEGLAAQLRLAPDEHPALEKMLEELQLHGLVVRVRPPGRRRSGWVDPELLDMVVGQLECNPKGFGFVTRVRGEGQDVHVPVRRMGAAVHGDLVLVQLAPAGRRRGREAGPAGEVVGVLRRAREQLIGTFLPGKREARVKPDEPSILQQVRILKGRESRARKDEKVLVEITGWPSAPGDDLQGRVVRVLGKEGDPQVDEASVILQFNLPDEFPSAALREGDGIPREPSEAERRGRRDFRRRLTIAIDPETAHDRDDALSLYRDDRTGNRVVLVHIADVSHYVRRGSALDLEARRRGVSVYLVSGFVPMLPLRPTQQALSFAEGKESLAKTVTLEFDDGAELVRSSISHAVVKTDRTMTYPEVKEILDAADSKDDAAWARAMGRWSPEVWNAITELDRLARQLRARRRRMGSVDLDVPEYDVRVDAEGRVTAVSQIERDRSHDLVEEFMLSANCAVARFLQKQRLPGIYRTHEEPDAEDLAAFAEFIRTVLGRQVNPHDRRQLQGLLREVADTSLSEAVNMELLRCMKRATYEPRPAPHFALHFPLYCHFTSPIRRYPDLVVHQVLDQHLDRRRGGRDGREAWDAALPAIALHCTEAEKRADEAEREIIKIKLLRFLKERGGPSGEVFDAVITGVQEYGVFAQLQDYSVEGLIRTGTLADDQYVFEQRQRALVGKRTGRTLRLGQSIHVLIEAIDIARRQMNLVLKA